MKAKASIKQRRRKAADHAEQELDPNKAIGEAAIQIARERAANAHREKVRADDGGELEDAVADQIAGERARNELIDEAARRNQQHGNEEQNAHALVNRRRQ